MSTGIISAMGNNASVTYTPGSDAELLLACSGSSTSVTVNGVAVFTGSANQTTANVKIALAAYSTNTIATGASVTCLASAVEG